tara:strand:- start:37 stop:792 length:756 start_codon:yes stop_codon:yes gene_type:complete
MLKKFVETLEGIPEELHGYYSKGEDGGFFLETDDDSLKQVKTKISEFRSNNIQLSKEKEDLQRKLSEFDEYDVEEIKEALKARQQVKEDELVPRSEIDKHLKKRIDQERKTYESQLSELSNTSSKLADELATMKIEKMVTESINRIGQLQKGALSDVLRRARMEIEVKDNELVERDSGLNLDPVSWAQNLHKNCPYFFAANVGIGARGSSDINSEPNPWQEGKENLTEQGRIWKESPDKARRLAAAAGKNL